MHFARSQAELESALERAWGTWSVSPDLAKFGHYFHQQWLTGKFMRWQCYHTPTGYAKTNNPVEQFNKVLKRDYTLRVRLKMGTLIEKLASCVRKHSRIDDKSEARREIKRLRTFRPKPRQENPVTMDSMTVYSSEDGDQTLLTEDEKDRLEKSMNVNAARMEQKGMPIRGWTVKISEKEIVTGVVERADMDGFSFDAQYHTYNQQHSGMSLNKAPLDSDADNVFTLRNVAKKSKRRTAQPKTFAQEFGSHERVLEHVSHYIMGKSMYLVTDEDLKYEIQRKMGRMLNDHFLDVENLFANRSGYCAYLKAVERASNQPADKSPGPWQPHNLSPQPPLSGQKAASGCLSDHQGAWSPAAGTHFIAVIAAKANEKEPSVADKFLLCFAPFEDETVRRNA
ncbi:hypothetical protein P43SY_004716 [Pythium insidiosum]|uniref:Uncharacterized protein n=1 Tax=Pythium insidiosum TaxID=114742 RepID=A0AAD5M3R6_PYTIN|nr:hypothetical protein P43SY_004716 [Pythium insidiosum]